LLHFGKKIHSVAFTQPKLWPVKPNGGKVRSSGVLNGQLKYVIVTWSKQKKTRNCLLMYTVFSI